MCTTYKRLNSTQSTKYSMLFEMAYQNQIAEFPSNTMRFCSHKNGFYIPTFHSLRCLFYGNLYLPITRWRIRLENTLQIKNLIGDLLVVFVLFYSTSFTHDRNLRHKRCQRNVQFVEIWVTNCSLNFLFSFYRSYGNINKRTTCLRHFATIV